MNLGAGAVASAGVIAFVYDVLNRVAAQLPTSAAVTFIVGATDVARIVVNAKR